MCPDRLQVLGVAVRCLTAPMSRAELVPLDSKLADELSELGLMAPSNVQTLTEHEVADRLRLSVATLRAWRLRNKGPRFVRFGRALRYPEEDVVRFVEACRSDSANRAPAS